MFTTTHNKSSQMTLPRPSNNRTVLVFSVVLLLLAGCVASSATDHTVGDHHTTQPVTGSLQPAEPTALPSPTPAPVPELPDGTNGFWIYLAKPGYWSRVQSDLANAFCTDSDNACKQIFWLPGSQDTTHGDNTKFLVAVKQNWMLYAVEGTALTMLGEGETYTALDIVKPLPELDHRGPNQVAFATSKRAWMKFPDLLSSILADVTDVTANDVTLANMTCAQRQLPNSMYFEYNCTFIVSFNAISLQVEAAAYPYVCEADHCTMSGTLFPFGVDLDTTTTKNLGNRLFFSFFFDSYAQYTDFNAFVKSTLNATLTQGKDTAPKGVYIQPGDATLVSAVVTYGQQKDLYGKSTNYFQQNFTIAFETNEQASKILTLLHDGKKGGSYNMKITVVEPAGGPSPVTDVPETQPSSHPATHTNAPNTVSPAPSTTYAPAPTDPAIPHGSYGFKVFLNKASSWYSVQRDLGSAFCIGSSIYCNGVDGGDFWLPGNQDTSSSMEFIVAVNVSWMLYAVEGTPASVLGSNYYSFETISYLPYYTERGPNMVQFKTTRSNWYTFPRFRRNILTQLSGVEAEDVTLVNMTCARVDTNYNCTYIVSFKHISTQVETASIPWLSNRFDDYNVWNATLFPIGVDLDRTTTSHLGNRVFFSFRYEYANRYVNFMDFVQNTVNYTLRYEREVKPKDVFVKHGEATLVKSGIRYNPLGDNRYFENFTISFAKPEQASKMIALVKDGKEHSSSSVTLMTVSAAASPDVSTPSPNKGATEGSNGNKSKTALIIGVVVAVVLVVVIIAIVAKTQSGGRNHTAGTKEEELITTSNSQV